MNSSIFKFKANIYHFIDKNYPFIFFIFKFIKLDDNNDIIYKKK